MQLGSIGSDDVPRGKAMKRAMILLAAASAAAAAGLATIDMPEADLTPSGLQTDANAEGVPASTTTEARAAPTPYQPDPELQRMNRGNDFRA